jgi:copper transport protein
MSTTIALPGALRSGAVALAIAWLAGAQPAAAVLPAAVSADAPPVVAADVAAAAALPHVTLVASRPDPGAVLDAAPSSLMLRFSGRIERAYTSMALVAPDGRDVRLGDIAFVPDSDREFSAAVPPLQQPGTYVVRWRTAGADGHVLEGSFQFVLRHHMAGHTVPDAMTPTDTVHAHRHLEDVFEVADVTGGGDAAAVLGRWLHFTALVLLLGAIAFRALLLPRLALPAAASVEAQRRSWGFLALAALLLAVAALLRLWQQSAAMHGGDRALDVALLSTMLQATTWGRAWIAQLLLLALLAAGMLLSRPGRDRAALFVAIPATLGLAAIPALTGHAAGAGGAFAALVVANDALHVAAAGAWLGTLLLVMVLLPGAVRGADGHAHMATAVERFSPLAVGAVAVLVATGVINSLIHLGGVRQLVETQWGVALLVKLGVFALVLATGFYNWRVLRPRLASGTALRRLRVSAGLELGFAALVLLATAVLTGLPRP